MRASRAGESQRAGRPPLNLLAISSVSHILGVMPICSLNYSEENRYLLSLLPADEMVHLWTVRRTRRPRLVAGARALGVTLFSLLAARRISLWKRVGLQPGRDPNRPRRSRMPT